MRSLNTTPRRRRCRCSRCWSSAPGILGAVTLRGVRPRPARRPDHRRLLVDLHRHAAAGDAEGARAAATAACARPHGHRRRRSSGSVARRPPTSPAQRRRRSPAADVATATGRRRRRPTDRAAPTALLSHPPRPRKKPALDAPRRGRASRAPLTAAERRRAHAAGSLGSWRSTRHWLARPRPRHPRLPAARRHVPRHHAAARRRRRVPPGRSTRSPTASPASRVDRVLGIEARGFILAAPVAYRLGAGFVPVRKAGKLPWAVAREEYAARVRHRQARDPPRRHPPGRAGADHRRRARHRRHGGGHRAGWSRRSAARSSGSAFLIELAVLGGRAKLGERTASRAWLAY